MYKPADYFSDSEEEYDEYDNDGFDFFSPNADKLKKTRIQNVIPKVEPRRDLFLELIHAGKWNKVMEKLETEDLKNDAILMDGWTILFHACKYGTLEIVNFLLNRGENINKQIDSTTPLMLACQNQTEDVIEIIKLLLRNGAVLNISDNRGKTPLMFAIGNGLTEAVKIFIKNASLEATDNDGWTALFHAVEANRFDCVKIMIEAGVDINACNGRGYTPKQVAESGGFQDIYDLFPKTDKELEFQIPTNHICYSEYKDLVPSIFKEEIPAYFPDIYSMLYGMRCENYASLFYQANISLEQFLSITDDKLEEMGVKFPFQRKRILLGLYLFHSHPWSKRTVSKIGLNDIVNIYDYYQLVASHLRQVVVLKAGIDYLQKHFAGPELQKHNKIDEIIIFVRNLKETVEITRERIVYLQTFNPPKPVYHIDSNCLLQLQKPRLSFAAFSKYSAYLGLGALIIYGLRKQIFKKNFCS